MPSWVSEGSIRKYNRAVAQLARDNADHVRDGLPVVEVTEAAIKALYVKWGGLVLGDVSTVHGVEEGTEAETMERSEERDAPVVEARKPRAKKK